jgi:Xaa-Pro aminopeptidase
LNTIIANRIKKLRTSLANSDIDTLLVLVEENRRYLSGFTGEDTQFDESAGALLINADRLVLATDSRYELQAETEAPLYDVVCYKQGLADELPGILGDLNTERLGFESIRMTCREHKKITDELAKNGTSADIVPVEDMVESLRIVKEEEEINALRQALKIAETSFTDLLSSLEPGMTEKEVAWMMEQRMRESGAEALSFPTIVAAGRNSALPHAIPGDRKIQAGEPVLFDWGARLNGYCSDISRSVVLGKPDQTFTKVFKVVLQAQKAAIEAIKPGMSSKAVDRVARNYIDNMGYGDKFGHGLGHGTGLAIHEAPRLSPLKDTVLVSGMVSTVEPGIYLPEWGGIRLENMIVVRDDGAEVLNNLDPSHYQV